jgi:hypothetical protein
MRKNTILFLMLGAFCPLQAQVIDIGFNLGASFYSGDLSSRDFRQMIQETSPAGGVFVRLVNSRQLSTRFNLNRMRVAGDDARTGRTDRGLNFRSDIWEFNTIFEWHAIRIRHSEYSFTFPYVFGGAGIYNFNPRAQLDGEWIELQPLGTEGQGLPGYGQAYNRTQFNLPFGAGIKFIHRQFTFGFEAGARRLFTDYLDDVSGTTVNHRDVYEGKGPLAARLSNPQLGGAEGINRTYRRGSEPRDWYYMMNITVSYNFGQAIYKMLTDPLPCPRFRMPHRRAY